jgi:hypothetical protein
MECSPVGCRAAVADPFDRMIAATALVRAVPLVTYDRRLRQLPALETVWWVRRATHGSTSCLEVLLRERHGYHQQYSSDTKSIIQNPM